MQDISNYEKIREDAHNFYQKIGVVRCPALNNEAVYFTAEGFNHLIYKGKRRERNKNDQIMKFKLLPKAKTLINLTTTHQGYDESITDIRKKRFKRTTQETATVKYWGFIAVLNNFRIKVIVRQIGNGHRHFWSVIPAWKTNHYRDIKLISIAKGDLAED